MVSRPARPAASSAFAAARLRLFTATWLSYAGFYFCRKVFGVVKGPLKAALQLDDLGVSHLFTAYLASYMLGQFATAWLGRRVHSRTLLLAGMSLSCAANFALGTILGLGARGYLLALLAMVIQGAAQATGWSANVALLTNWTQRAERGRVMAIWGTCYQIGAVAAKWFAAFMFGWLGLAWPFWGSAALLGAVILLFLRWGREAPESLGLLPPDPGTAAIADEGGGSEGGPVSGRALRIIITMGLIYFSFKFLRYALDSWCALVLADHFGLSTTRAGYLSAVFDLFGFLGVMVGGWSSDRIRGGLRTPVIFAMTGGLWLATVLLYLLGLSSVGWFVVLLGLIGFFALGPDSLLSGAGAMDVGPRRQAIVAAAIINGLGSVGPLVEEPVIGWLLTHAGLDSVLLLLLGVATLAVVSTGLFWQVARRRRIGI
jgi:sugar phosphate permease